MIWNTAKQLEYVGNLEWGRHVRRPTRGASVGVVCIGSRLDSEDSANPWILASGSLHQVRKALSNLSITFHFPTFYTVFYTTYINLYTIASIARLLSDTVPPQHITHFRSGHQVVFPSSCQRRPSSCQWLGHRFRVLYWLGWLGGKKDQETNRNDRFCWCLIY